MPELPDVVVYIERLSEFLRGHAIEKIRIIAPSLLKSFEVPIAEAEGKTVTGFRRLGKRIAFELEGDLFLVFHLMIAGRFRWRERGVKLSRKVGLAALDFEHGALMMTEASTKKRASLHLVRGEDALAEHDPGGVDLATVTPAEFHARLHGEPHTIKRTLTDPSVLSGIGNAYSDEILHRARLSPFKMAPKLSEGESSRLLEVCREVLTEWTDRLREQVGEGFPEKVTAFRPEMAVHGKFGEPCPACGTPVQRIVFADNECNYCPACQTDGKLLADRALSQLVKKDWPKTLEEMEERKRRLRDEDA